MTLIDAHTHAWGTNTAELPWRHEMLPPEWEGAYTHRDLIADMDRLDIDESVVVTTPLYGRGARANEYTMRCIEAHPDRLWGVGILDVFGDGERVRESVRRVVGHERMLGVRLHAALDYGTPPGGLDRTADWILDDGLDPFWAEISRQGTSVQLLAKAEQLPMIAELADRHPGITFVVDHMAWPDDQTNPDAPPWTDFEALGTADNVYAKVSSLPRAASEPWPYPDLHGYVRTLVEWFGPERLLLGSDYPWMDDWGSYEECLSWIEEVEFLSSRDYAYLSHRTFESMSETIRE